MKASRGRLNMSDRAKVFISCGQRTPDERKAADDIAGVLRDLGFEPYVAVQEQTLKGLRENIFWNLETSEYFLFVDFKRDQLANLPEFAGSLFSHQELALASYLDLDVIAFQQRGLRKEDGLMRFLQANSIEFERPDELPDLVEKRVKAVGWRPDWKNHLKLELCDPPFTDAWDVGTGEWNRFFHLRVTNLHYRKPALMCSAFVRSMVGRTTGEPIDFRMAELKWAGSSQLFASVPPGLAREVDLGYVPHRNPTLFVFNTFSTSTQYMPPLQGPGDYEIAYVVASVTFPLQSFLARVRVGTSKEEATVEVLSNPGV
jgi:hypothetical protein